MSEPLSAWKVLAPYMDVYVRLKKVVWPFSTIVASPGFTSDVVTIDSRGHRVSRVGELAARSDKPPENAGFVLGGSTAFGVGASTDAGTLASALWRRTGVPYVNLGIRAGSSTQELVSALPFADRSTTFVLCTGINNLARARGGPGLDPWYGAVFADAELELLSTVSVQRLAKLVRNPLGQYGPRELRRELLRRYRERMRKRLQHVVPRQSRPPSVRPQKQRKQADLIVAEAAARHLRDLRILRRAVPDDAVVVFALQPFAAHLERPAPPEEEMIFAELDALQRGQWKRMQEYLLTHWAPYAAALAEGCAALGVPFVDLGHADYAGWCFVDRVHLNDRGYDAAAAYLVDTVAPLGARAADAGTPSEPFPTRAVVSGATASERLEQAVTELDEDPSVYPLW